MSINRPANFEQLMKNVVSYSTEHVRDGGIPFTAFVIDSNGEVLGKGVNRVLENHDPTAHAEIEAIRDACRHTQSHQLNGMTLLASGEPCAMCYFNALYSGIAEVVFAVDRNEVAELGFDYRSSYRMLANFPSEWPISRHKHTTEKGLEPFKLFQKRRNY